MLYHRLSDDFASVYGTCVYNTSTYQNGSSCSQTVSTGNQLTNTGIAVAAIVTIVALTTLVAVVVRIWKRPNKK